MGIISRIFVCQKKVLIRKFNYAALKEFKWNVPEKFNFAQDVIDKHATDPDTVKSIAFHHLSNRTGTRKWTYEEFSEDSKKYAAAILALGRITRAVIVLPRIPEWWILNIAAMRTNTVLLPGTPQLTAKDLDKRLGVSKADAVIVDEVTAQKIEEVADIHEKTLKFKILIGGDANHRLKKKGWILFNDLLKQADIKDVPTLDTSSDQLMQIFFTSGTTGAPKMCAHTQGSYGYCHWVTGKWLGLERNSLHWNISDTGWAKSAWSNVFAPWTHAAGVFIHDMPRFEPQEVLKVLQNEPITTLCAPPTLYRSLVQIPDLDKFQTIKHCISAGEPLNENVYRDWHQKTGLWIREGYGQTETTLLAATFHGMKIKPGSMGKPAPGYDVRIVDDDAEELEINQEGNIAVYFGEGREKGGLFAGYVDRPEMTASVFKKDFYFTGDRGYVDGDGYIWFTSRQDDVIISAGYRIGPFEVESALIEHPAVIESAVVGSPDQERGQVVKAFIILSPAYKSKIEGNEKAEAKLVTELQNHVKATTAPYKYPRRIEFLDELPKTVSGKVRRTELRSLEN